MFYIVIIYKSVNSSKLPRKSLKLYENEAKTPRKCQETPNKYGLCRK